MNQVAVLETLAVRSLLNAAIDAAISKHFALDNKKTKIGRGVVHDLIAEELGVKLSRDLHILIRARIDLYGGLPSICRGRQYYRSLRLKYELARS